MKVTLRKRERGKKITLYLDYYENGNREYEYLQLDLIPEPEEGKLTKIQKDHNKKTLELAEAIRSKRFLEAQNSIYGFRDKSKLNASFFEYYEILKEKRRDSNGNYGNWDGAGKQLLKYSPQGVSFNKIDKKWVEGFKEYLDKKAMTIHGKPLSQNTKYSYFNKLRAALREALKDELINYNPCDHVKPFEQGEPQREFLTLDEVRQLANTHCNNGTLKNMFLFSCLTGLRWSDIEKLTWQDVLYSKELGHYLRFRQQKTNAPETLPIAEDARKLMGNEQDATEKVFPGVKYGNWNKTHIKEWVELAGINKKITFHCARHTYATLQLTLGTDIYTVSKLLGHKNLSTTEIYTKVINEKKVDAAKKIKL